MSEVRYRVHVTDEAVVVDRGERLRVWFVRRGDGWVRAHEHPDADTDTVTGESGGESCPPGTIWVRHVELLLDGGEVLLSRVTEPLIERLEPLDYLKKGKLRSGRAVSETYFAVTGNYRLRTLPGRPEKAPPPPEREAKAGTDKPGKT